VLRKQDDETISSIVTGIQGAREDFFLSPSKYIKDSIDIILLL